MAGLGWQLVSRKSGLPVAALRRERVVLTRRGRLLADTVARRLLGLR